MSDRSDAAANRIVERWCARKCYRAKGVNALLRKTCLWAPPILYAAIIFYLSSLPNPLPLLTAHVWDKWLHIVEYGGFSLLLCRALRGNRLRLWPSIILALIIASVYGATDEWHQFFVPGRVSDVFDWLADTIGGAAGSGLYVAASAMSPLPSMAQDRTRRTAPTTIE